MSRLDFYAANLLKKEERKTRKLANILYQSLTGKALGKIKKIPPGKRRKKLVKALDTEFSLYIREKWAKHRAGACVFPHCCQPIQHCFHFVTRAKYSVRWDERNAVGSCGGCNLRYEFDPHFAIQWYLNQFGREAYDKLIYDGNTLPKLSNDYMDIMLDSIKARREALL